MVTKNISITLDITDLKTALIYTGGCVEVTWKHYAIFYKVLEHPQILIFLGVSGTSLPQVLRDFWSKHKNYNITYCNKEVIKTILSKITKMFGEKCLLVWFSLRVIIYLFSAVSERGTMLILHTAFYKWGNKAQGS